MVVYEKMYLKAHLNNQCSWLKNNTTQLYFILGRANLSWNFSSLLRGVPDVHRFPTVYMIKTHLLLENLWIPEPSLGTVQTI